MKSMFVPCGYYFANFKKIIGVNFYGRHFETDGYIVFNFRHLINYGKVHQYAELDGYIFILYRAMNFHGQTTYGQILFILRDTFISTFSCVFAMFNNFPKLETLLIGHPVYSPLHTRSVGQ